MLAGCDGPDSPEILQQTALSFSQPKHVGTLPDGRNVSVVVREMGTNASDHFIYFVDNTISMNHTIQQGKQTRNNVTVLIDGIEYAPVDKTSKPKSP